MLAIPNSLNSGGRRRDPRSTAGLSFDEANAENNGRAALPWLPTLPPFGGGGSSTASVRVGMGALGASPFAMGARLPMMGGGAHSVQTFGGGGGGGYGGGGGSPGFHGGGSPSFDGLQHQTPFFSDRDGTTVAPVGQGAGAYHGLASFDAQFNDEEHPRPQLTSWGQEWGAAAKPPPPLQLTPSELERRAKGGPVNAGQPYLVGEKGPELVIPAQSGTVIPNNHVNWSDEYIPNFVPSLSTGGNFGSVAPLPEVGGLQATDVNGNVVGFSRGTVPQGTLPPPPSAPLRPSLETPEQYSARRESMNPQNIDVGFTPRPALHGFADADALRVNPQTREEAQYGRLNRSLMRAGMRDPRLGLALAGGRAAGQEAAIKMQFEREKEGNRVTHDEAENRRKREAAAGFVDLGGGPGQPYAPTVAAQRLTADQARQQAAEARALEQLGISKAQLGISQSQEQRAIGREQRELNPQGRLTSIEGTDLAVPTLNGHQVSRAPTMQQTAPAIPGMRTPGLNLPFFGQVMPSFQMPGQPAQFQPFNPKAHVEETKAQAATAKLEAQTIKDHYKQAKDLAEAIGAGKITDAAVKARLEALLNYHLGEYEKSIGLPTSTGMGDLKAAEAAIPPAPSTGKDSVAALIQRSK